MTAKFHFFNIQTDAVMRKANKFEISQKWQKQAKWLLKSTDVIR